MKQIEGAELAASVWTMLEDWKSVDLLVPADQIDPARLPLFDVLMFHRLIASMTHATPRELEEIRETFRAHADDSIFAALRGSTIEFQCKARELEAEGSAALDRALQEALDDENDEALVPLPSLVFSYARIAPDDARSWVENVIARGEPFPEDSTARFLKAALDRAAERAR